MIKYSSSNGTWNWLQDVVSAELNLTISSHSMLPSALQNFVGIIQIVVLISCSILNCVGLMFSLAT